MSAHSGIIQGMKEALQRLEGSHEDLQEIGKGINAFDTACYYAQRDQIKINEIRTDLRKIADKLPTSVSDWIRDGLWKIIERINLP